MTIFIADMSAGEWLGVFLAVGGGALLKLVGSVFIKSPVDGLATIYIRNRVEPLIVDLGKKLTANTEISNRALDAANFVKSQLPNGSSPGLTGYLEQQKVRG